MIKAIAKAKRKAFAIAFSLSFAHLIQKGDFHIV